MVDPATATQIAMIVGAAIIGGAAGGWRGMKGVKRQAGDEMAQAMAAQRERIDLLVTENRELKIKVEMLEREVRMLREELDIEKRITARLNPPEDDQP